MSFSKRFMSKSPFTFTAGLKEAAGKGKLDDNPKFKKAVEASGVNKSSVAKEGKTTETEEKTKKANTIKPGSLTHKFLKRFGGIYGYSNKDIFGD